jgi:chemotaxis protein MotA
MLVDGSDRAVINNLLTKDFQQTQDRHAWGIKIFTATGDVAPAMGMIGTLIGLVNMLATMEDPSTIGASMAVALLTTLYGAIIANIIALPIADKLRLRKTDEGRNMAICIDGVLAINDKQNPRIIEPMLNTYLSPQQRKGDHSKESEAA